MVNLDAVGFGLPPEEKLDQQAAYLAHAALPYLKDAVETARSGKVTWDKDAMELIFRTLDRLSQVIDEQGDFEEGEKLLLHAVFSFIIRLKQSGMLTEKKMKITAAMVDIFIELYSSAAQIAGLEVDRSGV